MEDEHAHLSSPGEECADHGIQVRGVRRRANVRTSAQAAEQMSKSRGGFPVTHRFLVSTGVVGIFLAVVWLPRVPVAAQAPTVPVRPTGQAKTAKTWTAPRTPDGQPDLQGFWTNSTYTTLERPKNVTKEFYSEEEAREIAKRAADVEEEQTVPGTVADVHYDFTQFGLDRSQGAMALNLRTSLIVDLLDDQIPPMTTEAKKRVAARAEATKRMGAATDAPQNEMLSAR